MVTATVSEARRNFADLIETAQHEAVVVVRHGEPMAVTLSGTEYERLRQAADDLRAFDASMAAEGANVPLTQVEIQQLDLHDPMSWPADRRPTLTRTLAEKSTHQANGSANR